MKNESEAILIENHNTKFDTFGILVHTCVVYMRFMRLIKTYRIPIFGKKLQLNTDRRQFSNSKYVVNEKLKFYSILKFWVKVQCFLDSESSNRNVKVALGCVFFLLDNYYQLKFLVDNFVYWEWACLGKSKKNEKVHKIMIFCNSMKKQSEI